MVYHWEQHKDECYRFYIQERKSLEDIMHYMRDRHNFTPSKRAYQTQFRRWDFPSKQNPAHRNTDLVSRVRELWEQNYSQRDMLRTLNDEGFEIKERELMRVRAKNRWLLRIPNGSKQAPEEEDAFQLELLEAAGISQETLPPDHEPAPTPTVPVEVLHKRKERHSKLQAESDERWASKKRRRRTREYAGLAADPPGPPRFPSETTLGESMEFLALGGELYKQVRHDFQRICEHEGIVKKTLAGAVKWQSVKHGLIQENTHLRDVFGDDRNRAAKELALDVICTDVTKRMRTAETRMTIVDAKNILGLNPEQSRQVRQVFFNLLENDHFISKLEAGPEQWEDLKEQWIAKTPLLSQMLVPGHADPEHERKKKAMEVLCRDVMKRLRDSQKRTRPRTTTVITPDLSGGTPSDFSLAQQPDPLPAFDVGDLQIDPTLLTTTTFPAEPPTTLAPTAIYVRPHPKSPAYSDSKMWLATLMTRTVQELHGLVQTKWPQATVTRLEGMEKDGNGQEVLYLIEEDEELDAYLDHVNGKKATFMVVLNKC